MTRKRKNCLLYQLLSQKTMTKIQFLGCPAWYTSESYCIGTMNFPLNWIYIWEKNKNQMKQCSWLPLVRKGLGKQSEVKSETDPGRLSVRLCIPSALKSFLFYHLCVQVGNVVVIIVLYSSKGNSAKIWQSRLTCSVSFTEKYILFVITFRKKNQQHKTKQTPPTNTNAYSSRYNLWHPAVPTSLLSHDPGVTKHEVQFLEPHGLLTMGPLQAPAARSPQCHRCWKQLK